MKHIDSRVLWLQDLIAAGGVKLKKIPRAQNLADMLTLTLQCEGTGGLCSDQEKELVATRQYKPVPVKAEAVSKTVSVQWDSRGDRENVEHE